MAFYLLQSILGEPSSDPGHGERTIGHEPRGEGLRARVLGVPMPPARTRAKNSKKQNIVKPYTERPREGERQQKSSIRKTAQKNDQDNRRRGGHEWHTAPESGRLTNSTTSGCSKSSPLTASLCPFAAMLHVGGFGFRLLSLLGLGPKL